MGTRANCGSSSTIRSHLFPKGFCRQIGVDLEGEPEDFPHMYAGADRFRLMKTGIVDHHILCASCAQILGRLDGELLEWSERTKFEVVYRCREELPTAYRVVGNPRRVLLFALSLLRRFAVSTSPEAASLRMGPYTERIRAILFSRSEIGPNIDCFVIAAKTDIEGAENMYRTPWPIKNEFLNGYCFYLNGFEYLIRLGVERRPTFSGQDAGRWWLRSADRITLPVLRFEETATGAQWLQLRRAGHSGFAYATRDKKRSRRS